MAAVDTNVLVRLMLYDDSVQSAVAERFVANGAWVSHLVLAEAVWVLTNVYAVETERVEQMVEMLLDHRRVTMEDSDVVRRALQQFRTVKGVGFSDCLILEIARKAGELPLATFDRRLARLPSVHGLR